MNSLLTLLEYNEKVGKMSTLRSITKEKQEMEQMEKCLSNHGMSPMATAKEKLHAVWRLYQQAEDDIKAGSQSMEELQMKQAEEMKEVELYVENIRKLSEERELLTQEFETENEELKVENQRLKQEKELTNKEMRQLLTQEGFDDLAKGTVSEALAYFLVERTQLSDKVDRLEAERRKSPMMNGPSKLNGEKADKLADKLLLIKSEKEKQRLEQESRQQIQRVKELELELKMLKTRLDKEKEMHHKEIERVQKKAEDRSRGSSPTGQSNDPSAQLRETKRKLEQELMTMKYRMRTSEEEKEKVAKKVKELTETLEAERKRRSSYEGTIIKLKHLLDTNRKTISSLEEEKSSWNQEKKSLAKKVDLLQKDNEFRTKEVPAVKQPDPHSTNSVDIIRLQEEVKRLQKQNETCVSRLEETMISLESEKMKCRELDRKLSTTEEKWELVVKRYRDNERQLNTKLDKLGQELDSSKTSLSGSQLDILRLQAENKRVLNTSTSDRDRVRDQLEHSVLNKEVERHRETIGELEGLVDGLKKDRDVLAHELQAMLGKEQRHKEWAGSMEGLDKENRDLRDRLESSLGKHTLLQQELDVEKRRVKDLSARLRTSEDTVDQLQEQLGRKSVELVRYFDNSKEGQNKMESELQSLKKDLEIEKARAVREREDMNRIVDREERRIKDLEEQISHKNEEMGQLRREIGRLSLDGTKSDEKVHEEARRRSDIESRNKVLEEEMTKLWSQLKGMMDRLSEAEKAKHDVEAELTRIPELQTELDRTSLRLQAAEVQLKDYGALKVDLQDNRDEIARLKGQLQDDKLQKSLLTQQVEDLRIQGKAGRDLEDQLRKENIELKDQLMDIQAKLYHAEDASRSVNDKHNMSEQSRTSLLQQVSNLQTESENLRQELGRVSAQLDAQIRKYQDHKNNTKTKMQQARDIFNKQKGMLGDSLMKLQGELNSTRGELQKTTDFQSSADNKYQTLLSEHRDLLTKTTELEELTRDQGRDMGTQDYRVKFLERENAMFQERIETLSKQRMALEKLVREYRLEKQKDDINRSIGNMSPGQNYGLYSQPLGTLGTSLGYSIPKMSPSSGLGHSVSNFSTMDTPNGHHDGLLVKTSHANGPDLPLESPSTTLISNGGSI